MLKGFGLSVVYIVRDNIYRQYLYMLHKSPQGRNVIRFVLRDFVSIDLRSVSSGGIFTLSAN